jgi:CIC family chloride channel protein
MPESRLTYTRLSSRMRQLLRNDHMILSVLALVVGSLVGISVVGFREAIDLFQGVFYGFDGFYGNDSEHLPPIAAELPGWRVVLATTLGGLIVGVMVH